MSKLRTTAVTGAAGVVIALGAFSAPAMADPGVNQPGGDTQQTQQSSDCSAAFGICSDGSRTDTDTSGGTSEGSPGAGEESSDQNLDKVKEELGNHNQEQQKNLDEKGGLRDVVDGTKINNEDLANASEKMAPLTKFVKGITSALIIFLIAILGLMTMLDLVYINVPLFRGLLHSAGDPGNEGASGGFTGQDNASRGGWQAVSDEALAAVALARGEGGSAGGAGGFGAGFQQGLPGGGGFGMPFHGTGGAAAMGGMGGMGMNNDNPAQGKARGTANGRYIRARLWSLIMLAIGLALLTSSIAFDFGLSVGGFLVGLFDLASDFVRGIGG